MRILLLSFIGIVFMFSCNSQQKKETIKKETLKKSNKIEVFLKEKNFKILNNSNQIIEYIIQNTLIEGTVDEYSNKLFLKDTLEQATVQKLVSYLILDSSYSWDDNRKEATFTPSRQFLIKGESSRLTLLVNKDATKLGFINLEGQKIVMLSEALTNYLNSL
ncbi:hypothetical protein CLV91_0731 [Maribacter vaceletii]|uniref:Uncharacterized protein n=1 Tax=Maribacter vaceletii TaxID=1206816 RepID=A0A495EDP1_9FLAO|nr:hypothetical protein [Maribacter vaceletii]RKR14653.1 hypothetical protein CLV91_0731 [Maribacter vaceletii]